MLRKLSRASRWSDAPRRNVATSAMSRDAFFARRKRGLDFLHRREAEVAAFLTEQARLDRERQEREKGEIGRLIESLPTDALQPEPLRRPADLDLTTPAGAGR